MRIMPSARLDALSSFQPGVQLSSASKPVAKAAGLTVDEALDLAAWLKEAGYRSIEVIDDANDRSVLWS